MSTISSIRSCTYSVATFVTHDESAAADALRQYIRREMSSETTVSEHGESVRLESRSAA